MKKIVGIIAAVAMAASVFAVDFSAGTKIGGSLFNFDGSNVTFLKEDNDSHDYANPNFSFSISDDKAGASINISTDGGNTGGTCDYEAKLTSQSIWFKPFDVLKITVGKTDTNLNQETITYGGTESGIGGNGYSLALTPAEGLEFDVFLCMDRGKWWFDGTNLNELSFKFQYGGDFGTINAIFQGKNTFADLKFGAGYKNTFDPVTFWVNVLGYVSGGAFTKIRPEVFANGSADAFSWAVFVASDIPLAGGNVALKAIGKISYNIDPVTIYLQVTDNDILASAFAMTIKPGISGSCGLMGWDVAAEFAIGSTVTIGIPVSFAVSF